MPSQKYQSSYTVWLPPSDKGRYRTGGKKFRYVHEYWFVQIERASAEYWQRSFLPSITGDTLELNKLSHNSLQQEKLHTAESHRTSEKGLFKELAMESDRCSRTVVHKERRLEWGRRLVETAVSCVSKDADMLRPFLWFGSFLTVGTS